MGLLDDTAQPPVAALAAEPFTLLEIDAHPDANRIWATILALRAEVQTLVAEAYTDGMNDGVAGCY